jgi:hypothetical protein
VAKLKFPADYPFKPPSIYMCTPSGRFATGQRLCLSMSDFHPETWNPGWSVATVATGLLSFMCEDVAGPHHMLGGPGPPCRSHAFEPSCLELKVSYHAASNICQAHASLVLDTRCESWFLASARPWPAVTTGAVVSTAPQKRAMAAGPHLCLSSTALPGLQQNASFVPQISAVLPS